ncbi:MAG: S4A5 electrogenic sodium bicarbonate cotransporter 4 [Raoultibacter sp.]
MTRSKGSVRMGPATIFSLVILLCLAVLAVLAVTTSQATYAVAHKQVRFSTDTYANETAAQEFVATLDGTLAKVRIAQGNGTQAADALRSTLPANARIDGDTVRAQFISDSGRRLDITILIDNAACYRITQWKATTQWQNDNHTENLWPGSTK